MEKDNDGYKTVCKIYFYKKFFNSKEKAEDFMKSTNDYCILEKVENNCVKGDY